MSEFGPNDDLAGIAEKYNRARKEASESNEANERADTLITKLQDGIKHDWESLPDLVKSVGTGLTVNLAGVIMFTLLNKYLDTSFDTDPDSFPIMLGSVMAAISAQKELASRRQEQDD